jgi:ankyrin repeat protein
MTRDEKALDRVKFLTYNALLLFCHKPNGNLASSRHLLVEWHQQLYQVAQKAVSWTTRQSDANFMNGKPWNIEVRVAPALYHRCKDRCGEWKITSSFGLSRSIRSPKQFAQLICSEIEDGMDCRVSESGFLCITTRDRIEQLRASGKLPCPKCIQWCKGEKGLWWHSQQQHGVGHHDAMDAAVMVQNVNAIVVYGDSTSDLDLLIRPKKIGLQTPNTASLDEDPFRLAQHGDLESLQKLVEHGFDPIHTADSRGANVLLWAAGGGHLDMLRYLIETCGCDPAWKQKAKRSFGGRTALHWAARKGHVEVCRYLVNSCNVDLEAITTDGTTAFSWASWQAHRCVMQFLHSSGCNVTSSNTFGCNAALWAAQGAADSAVMEWLDRIGCSVFQVNSNGHGVLHKAAQRGREDVSKWFVEHLFKKLLEMQNSECDIDLQLIGPDSDKCTPSDLAGMESHEELAKWIASQEMLFIGLLSQSTRKYFVPEWLKQTPSVESYDLRWEAGAGLMRLQTVFHRMHN